MCGSHHDALRRHSPDVYRQGQRGSLSPASPLAAPPLAFSHCNCLLLPQCAAGLVVYPPACGPYGALHSVGCSLICVIVTISRRRLFRIVSSTEPLPSVPIPIAPKLGKSVSAVSTRPYDRRHGAPSWLRRRVQGCFVLTCVRPRATSQHAYDLARSISTPVGISSQHVLVFNASRAPAEICKNRASFDYAG